MVACLLIPGFELRAALRARPRLALVPAALAPDAGEEPLLGPVTVAAEAAGVKPGMRLGEALATCPSLVLVDRDPATVEREWEGVLRRLEDTGFAVDPVDQGTVVFETSGVERLYGGVQPALERALAAVGPTWDPHVGAADRRFTALAAASVARPGQILLVAAKEEEEFLEPLPLSLLPMTPNRYAELEGLGLRSLGELRRLPAGAVAERLGAEGRTAWRLAQGGRKALGSLLERLLARPERAGRPFRKLALVARLVDGGSWRRVATLRDATAEMPRLRAALGPKLQELPAPIVELRLEAIELAEHTGQQLALVEPAGEENVVRLREGLKQVKASTGSGSVCAVVEVAPWSRVPEARALVVPRDD
jgi:protein ImuB